MGLIVPLSTTTTKTTTATAATVIKTASAIVAAGGVVSPVLQAAVRAAAVAPSPNTLIQTAGAVAAPRPVVQVGTVRPVVQVGTITRPVVQVGTTSPMIPAPAPVVVTPAAGATIIKNAGAITAAGGVLTPAQQTVVQTAVNAVATGTPKPLPTTQSPPIMALPPSDEIIVASVTIPTSETVKAGAMITPPALPAPSAPVNTIQVGGGMVASNPVRQAQTVSINSDPPRPVVQVGTTRPVVPVGGGALVIGGKLPEVASSPVKKALTFGVPAALLLWALV